MSIFYYYCVKCNFREEAARRLAAEREAAVLAEQRAELALNKMKLRDNSLDTPSFR